MTTFVEVRDKMSVEDKPYLLIKQYGIFDNPQSFSVLRDIPSVKAIALTDGNRARVIYSCTEEFTPGDWVPLE